MKLYKVIGYTYTKDGVSKRYEHIMNNYDEALNLSECWLNVWGYFPVYILRTTLEKENKIVYQV